MHELISKKQLLILGVLYGVGLMTSFIALNSPHLFDVFLENNAHLYAFFKIILAIVVIATLLMSAFLFYIAYNILGKGVFLAVKGQFNWGNIGKIVFGGIGVLILCVCGATFLLWLFT